MYRAALTHSLQDVQSPRVSPISNQKGQVTHRDQIIRCDHACRFFGLAGGETPSICHSEAFRIAPSICQVRQACFRCSSQSFWTWLFVWQRVQRPGSPALSTASEEKFKLACVWLRQRHPICNYNPTKLCWSSYGPATCSRERPKTSAASSSTRNS